MQWLFLRDQMIMYPTYTRRNAQTCDTAIAHNNLLSECVNQTACSQLIVMLLTTCYKGLLTTCYKVVELDRLVTSCSNNLLSSGYSATC
jgi:hypothetical protein